MDNKPSGPVNCSSPNSSTFVPRRDPQAAPVLPYAAGTRLPRLSGAAVQASCSSVFRPRILHLTARGGRWWWLSGIRFVSERLPENPVLSQWACNSVRCL